MPHRSRRTAFDAVLGRGRDSREISAPLHADPSVPPVNNNSSYIFSKPPGGSQGWFRQDRNSNLGVAGTKTPTYMARSKVFSRRLYNGSAWLISTRNTQQSSSNTSLRPSSSSAARATRLASFSSFIHFQTARTRRRRQAPRVPLSARKKGTYSARTRVGSEPNGDSSSCGRIFALELALPRRGHRLLTDAIHAHR